LNAPAIIGWALVGALLLAWSIWMFFPRNDRDSNDDGLIASKNQLTNETNSDSPDPISELNESETTELDPPAAGIPSINELQPLTDAEMLSHSLFLLVCSDQDSKMHFRVGTAFAVDAKHVATSASVISIMRDLQENGFPQNYLYHPESKKKIDILSTRVHPQYLLANSEARRAQQEHDGIVDDLESQPPDPDAFDSVKERLVAARLKALEAIERKTTCDVGILETGQSLEYWLKGIESTGSLRPKLKLNVTGFAFDLEDPYFDISTPVKLSTMNSRVTQISKRSNDSLQRLEAIGSPTQLEYSYLGSPALNDLGQVVAIYSRPAPPENAPGESSQNRGTGTRAEFDAPLFIRIRECWENPQ
jgi:hypothetical protein